MEKRIRFPKKKFPATHSVFFRASTDGIKSLNPIDLSCFTFTLACNQCGKTFPLIKFDNIIPEVNEKEEKVDNPLVLKQTCPGCNQNLSLSVYQDFHDQPFIGQCKWNNALNLNLENCRIDIVKCDKWKIISNSDQTYNWDGEDSFSEYDEVLNAPIGISDLDYVVRPYKPI